MDIQLPPARLQTQAGERDAEQRGENEQKDRNELVLAARSRRVRPCATGAVL